MKTLKYNNSQMRILYLLTFFLLLPVIAYSQITITPGSYFVNSGTVVLNDMDIIDSGTFNSTSGTIIFVGTSNSSIGGNGTFTAYNITVNKSQNTNIVFLNGNLTLTGILTLLSGDFEINNNNTLTLGDSAGISETTLNYVKGNIYTSRTVDTAQSVFGNLGFSLGSGNNNLGTVAVTRNAGTDSSIIIKNGNSGIKRKWIATSTNPPSSGRTLTLNWLSSDDNGIVWSPSRRAIVYRSTDNGATFWQVGEPVDVSGSNPRSISVNINSLSVYTVGAEDAPLMASTFVNITAVPLGFYNSVTMNSRDTIFAYLASNTPPYTIIDSAKAYMDSVTLTGTFKFDNAPSGTYYIILRHRNSLETWSRTGGETYTRYTIMNYNFTTDSSKAFGNNLVKSGTKWCIINGDCNRDDYIDGSDYIDIFNHYDEEGYLVGDTNGDMYVDGSDYIAVFNNYDVGSITPLTFLNAVTKIKKEIHTKPQRK